MNVYRLDPIDLAHLRWKVSSRRETVWAGAANPDEARQLVASKTIQTPKDDRVAVRLMSPWLDDRLTSCVLEPSRTDVPDGVVVDAKGAEVS